VNPRNLAELSVPFLVVATGVELEVSKERTLIVDDADGTSLSGNPPSVL